MSDLCAYKYNFTGNGQTLVLVIFFFLQYPEEIHEEKLFIQSIHTNVYFKSHKYSLSNTYKLQDYPLTNDETRYVLGTTLKNANSLVAGRMDPSKSVTFVRGPR